MIKHKPAPLPKLKVTEYREVTETDVAKEEMMKSINFVKKSYTKEENYRAYKLFSMMDVDGGGSISLRELNRVLMGEVVRFVTVAFDHPDNGLLFGLDEENCVIIQEIEADSVAVKFPFLITRMRLFRMNDFKVKLYDARSLQKVYQELIRLSEDPVEMDFVEPLIIINKFSSVLDIEVDGQVYSVHLPIGAFYNHKIFLNLVGELMDETSPVLSQIDIIFLEKKRQIIFQSNIKFKLLFQSGPNFRRSCRYALGFSAEDTPLGKRHEGQPLLMELNLGISQEKMEILMVELFQQFDKDGSGEFEFEEFRDFYIKYLDNDESIQRMKDYATFRFRDIERERFVQEQQAERINKWKRKQYLKEKEEGVVQAQKDKFKTDSYVDQFGIRRRVFHHRTLSRTAIVQKKQKKRRVKTTEDGAEFSDEDEDEEGEEDEAEKAIEPKKSTLIPDDEEKALVTEAETRKKKLEIPELELKAPIEEKKELPPEETAPAPKKKKEKKQKAVKIVDSNDPEEQKRLEEEAEERRKMRLKQLKEKRMLQKLKLEGQAARRKKILQQIYQANAELKKNEITKAKEEEERAVSSTMMELHHRVKRALIESMKINRTEYSAINNFSIDWSKVLTSPAVQVTPAIFGNSIQSDAIDVEDMASNLLHPAVKFYYLLKENHSNHAETLNSEYLHPVYFHADYIRQPTRHSSAALAFISSIKPYRDEAIKYRAARGIKRITAIPPEDILPSRRKAEENRKVRFLDGEQSNKTGLLGRLTINTVKLFSLPAFHVTEKNSPFVTFVSGDWKATTEIYSYAGSECSWDDLNWVFRLYKKDEFRMKVYTGSKNQNYFIGKFTINAMDLMNNYQPDEKHSLITIKGNLEDGKDDTIPGYRRKFEGGFTEEDREELEIQKLSGTNNSNKDKKKVKPKYVGKFEITLFVEKGQEWDWYIKDYIAKKQHIVELKHQIANFSKTYTPELEDYLDYPIYLTIDSILLVDVKSVHWFHKNRLYIILDAGTTEISTIDDNPLINNVIQEDYSAEWKFLGWNFIINKSDLKLIFKIYSLNIFIGHFILRGRMIFDKVTKTTKEIEFFGEVINYHAKNEKNRINGKIHIKCNILPETFKERKLLHLDSLKIQQQQHDDHTIDDVATFKQKQKSKVTISNIILPCVIIIQRIEFQLLNSDKEIIDPATIKQIEITMSCLHIHFGMEIGKLHPKNDSLNHLHWEFPITKLLNMSITVAWNRSKKAFANFKTDNLLAVKKTIVNNDENEGESSSNKKKTPEATFSYQISLHDETSLCGYLILHGIVTNEGGTSHILSLLEESEHLVLMKNDMFGTSIATGDNNKNNKDEGNQLLYQERKKYLDEKISIPWKDIEFTETIITTNLPTPEDKENYNKYASVCVLISEIMLTDLKNKHYFKKNSPKVDIITGKASASTTIRENAGKEAIWTGLEMNLLMERNSFLQFIILSNREMIGNVSIPYEELFHSMPDNVGIREMNQAISLNNNNTNNISNMDGQGKLKFKFQLITKLKPTIQQSSLEMRKDFDMNYPILINLLNLSILNVKSVHRFHKNSPYVKIARTSKRQNDILMTNKLISAGSYGKWINLFYEIILDDSSSKIYLQVLSDSIVIGTAVITAEQFLHAMPNRLGISELDLQILGLDNINFVGDIRLTYSLEPYVDVSNDNEDDDDQTKSTLEEDKLSRFQQPSDLLSMKDTWITIDEITIVLNQGLSKDIHKLFHYGCDLQLICHDQIIGLELLTTPNEFVLMKTKFHVNLQLSNEDPLFLHFYEPMKDPKYSLLYFSDDAVSRNNSRPTSGNNDNNNNNNTGGAGGIHLGQSIITLQRILLSCQTREGKYIIDQDILKDEKLIGLIILSISFPKLIESSVNSIQEELDDYHDNDDPLAIINKNNNQKKNDENDDESFTVPFSLTPTRSLSASGTPRQMNTTTTSTISTNQKRQLADEIIKYDNPFYVKIHKIIINNLIPVSKMEENNKKQQSSNMLLTKKQKHIDGQVSDDEISKEEGNTNNQLMDPENAALDEDFYLIINYDNYEKKLPSSNSAGFNVIEWSDITNLTYLISNAIDKWELSVVFDAFYLGKVVINVLDWLEKCRRSKKMNGISINNGKSNGIVYELFAKIIRDGEMVGKMMIFFTKNKIFHINNIYSFPDHHFHPARKLNSNRETIEDIEAENNAAEARRNKNNHTKGNNKNDVVVEEEVRSLGYIQIQYLAVNQLTQIYDLFPNSPKIIFLLGDLEYHSEIAFHVGTDHTWDNLQWGRIPFFPNSNLKILVMSNNELIGKLEISFQELKEIILTNNYEQIDEDYSSQNDNASTKNSGFTYRKKKGILQNPIIIKLNRSLLDGQVFKGNMEIAFFGDLSIHSLNEYENKIEQKQLERESRASSSSVATSLSYSASQTNTNESSSSSYYSSASSASSSHTSSHRRHSKSSTGSDYFSNDDIDDDQSSVYSAILSNDHITSKQYHRDIEKKTQLSINTPTPTQTKLIFYGISLTELKKIDEIYVNSPQVSITCGNWKNETSRALFAGNKATWLFNHNNDNPEFDGPNAIGGNEMRTKNKNDAWKIEVKGSPFVRISVNSNRKFLGSTHFMLRELLAMPQDEIGLIHSIHRLESLENEFVGFIELCFKIDIAKIEISKDLWEKYDYHSLVENMKMNPEEKQKYLQFINQMNKQTNAKELGLLPENGPAVPGGEVDEDDRTNTNTNTQSNEDEESNFDDEDDDDDEDDYDESQESSTINDDDETSSSLSSHQKKRSKNKKKKNQKDHRRKVSYGTKFIPILDRNHQFPLMCKIVSIFLDNVRRQTWLEKNSLTILLRTESTHRSSSLKVRRKGTLVKLEKLDWYYRLMNEENELTIVIISNGKVISEIFLTAEELIHSTKKTYQGYCEITKLIKANDPSKGSVKICMFINSLNALYNHQYYPAKNESTPYHPSATAGGSGVLEGSYYSQTNPSNTMTGDSYTSLYSSTYTQSQSQSQTQSHSDSYHTQEERDGEGSYGQERSKDHPEYTSTLSHSYTPSQSQSQSQSQLQSHSHLESESLTHPSFQEVLSNDFENDPQSYEIIEKKIDYVNNIYIKEIEKKDKNHILLTVVMKLITIQDISKLFHETTISVISTENGKETSNILINQYGYLIYDCHNLLQPIKMNERTIVKIIVQDRFQQIIGSAIFTINDFIFTPIDPQTNLAVVTSEMTIGTVKTASLSFAFERLPGNIDVTPFLHAIEEAKKPPRKIVINPDAYTSVVELPNITSNSNISIISIEVKELKAIHKYGKNSPLITLEYFGKRFLSQCLPGAGSNATWNDLFWNMKCRDDAILKFKVLSSSVSIGIIYIPVKELYAFVPDEFGDIILVKNIMKDITTENLYATKYESYLRSKEIHGIARFTIRHLSWQFKPKLLHTEQPQVSTTIQPAPSLTLSADGSSNNNNAMNLNQSSVLSAPLSIQERILQNNIEQFQKLNITANLNRFGDSVKSILSMSEELSLLYSQHTEHEQQQQQQERPPEEERELGGNSLAFEESKGGSEVLERPKRKPRRDEDDQSTYTTNTNQDSYVDEKGSFFTSPELENLPPDGEQQSAIVSAIPSPVRSHVEDTASYSSNAIPAEYPSPVQKEHLPTTTIASNNSALRPKTSRGDTATNDSTTVGENDEIQQSSQPSIHFTSKTPANDSIYSKRKFTMNLPGIEEKKKKKNPFAKGGSYSSSYNPSASASRAQTPAADPSKKEKEGGVDVFPPIPNEPSHNQPQQEQKIEYQASSIITTTSTFDGEVFESPIANNHEHLVRPSLIQQPQQQHAMQHPAFLSSTSKTSLLNSNPEFHHPAAAAGGGSLSSQFLPVPPPDQHNLHQSQQELEQQQQQPMPTFIRNFKFSMEKINHIHSSAPLSSSNSHPPQFAREQIAFYTSYHFTKKLMRKVVSEFVAMAEGEDYLGDEDDDEYETEKKSKNLPEHPILFNELIPSKKNYYRTKTPPNNHSHSIFAFSMLYVEELIQTAATHVVQKRLMDEIQERNQQFLRYQQRKTFLLSPQPLPPKKHLYEPPPAEQPQLAAKSQLEPPQSLDQTQQSPTRSPVAGGGDSPQQFKKRKGIIMKSEKVTEVTKNKEFDYLKEAEEIDKQEPYKLERAVINGVETFIPQRARLTFLDILGMDISCIDLRIIPTRPYLTACKAYSNWSAETNPIKIDLSPENIINLQKNLFILNYYNVTVKYHWEKCLLRRGQEIIFNLHDARSGLIFAKCLFPYERLFKFPLMGSEDEFTTTNYLLFDIAHEYGGGQIGGVFRVHLDLTVNRHQFFQHSSEYWNFHRAQHWSIFPIPPITYGIIRQKYHELASEYDNQSIVHPSLYGFKIRYRGNPTDESKFIHPIFHHYNLAKKTLFHENSNQKGTSSSAVAKHNALLKKSKPNPWRWDPSDRDRGTCIICGTGLTGCPRCFMMPQREDGGFIYPGEFAYDPEKERQKLLAMEKRLIELNIKKSRHIMKIEQTQKQLQKEEELKKKHANLLKNLEEKQKRKEERKRQRKRRKEGLPIEEDKAEDSKEQIHEEQQSQVEENSTLPDDNSTVMTALTMEKPLEQQQGDGNDLPVDELQYLENLKNSVKRNFDRSSTKISKTMSSLQSKNSKASRQTRTSISLATSDSSSKKPNSIPSKDKDNVNAMMKNAINAATTTAASSKTTTHGTTVTATTTTSGNDNSTIATTESSAIQEEGEENDSEESNTANEEEFIPEPDPEEEKLPPFHTNLTTFQALRAWRIHVQPTFNVYIKVMPTGYIKRLTCTAWDTIFQLYQMFYSHSTYGISNANPMILLPLNQGLLEFHSELSFHTDLTLADKRGYDTLSDFKINERNANYVFFFINNYKNDNLLKLLEIYFNYHTLHKLNIEKLGIFTGNDKLPMKITDDNVQKYLVEIISHEYLLQQKDLLSYYDKLGKEYKKNFYLKENREKYYENIKNEFLEKEKMKEEIRLKSQMKTLSTKIFSEENILNEKDNQKKLAKLNKTLLQRQLSKKKSQFLIKVDEQEIQSMKDQQQSQPSNSLLSSLVKGSKAHSNVEQDADEQDDEIRDDVSISEIILAEEMKFEKDRHKEDYLKLQRGEVLSSSRASSRPSSAGSSEYSEDDIIDEAELRRVDDDIEEILQDEDLISELDEFEEAIPIDSVPAAPIAAAAIEEDDERLGSGSSSFDLISGDIQVGIPLVITSRSDKSLSSLGSSVSNTKYSSSIGEDSHHHHDHSENDSQSYFSTSSKYSKSSYGTETSASSSLIHSLISRYSRGDSVTSRMTGGSSGTPSSSVVSDWIESTSRSYFTSNGIDSTDTSLHSIDHISLQSFGSESENNSLFSGYRKPRHHHISGGPSHHPTIPSSQSQSWLHPSNTITNTLTSEDVYSHRNEKRKGRRSSNGSTSSYYDQNEDDTYASQTTISVSKSLPSLDIHGQNNNNQQDNQSVSTGGLFTYRSNISSSNPSEYSLHSARSLGSLSSYQNIPSKEDDDETRTQAESIASRRRVSYADDDNHRRNSYDSRYSQVSAASIASAASRDSDSVSLRTFPEEITNQLNQSIHSYSKSEILNQEDGDEEQSQLSKMQSIRSHQTYSIDSRGDGNSSIDGDTTYRSTSTFDHNNINEEEEEEDLRSLSTAGLSKTEGNSITNQSKYSQGSRSVTSNPRIRLSDEEKSNNNNNDVQSIGYEASRSTVHSDPSSHLNSLSASIADQLKNSIMEFSQASTASRNNGSISQQQQRLMMNNNSSSSPHYQSQLSRSTRSYHSEESLPQSMLSRPKLLINDQQSLQSYETDGDSLTQNDDTQNDSQTVHSGITFESFEK